MKAAQATVLAAAMLLGASLAPDASAQAVTVAGRGGGWHGGGGGWHGGGGWRGGGWHGGHSHWRGGVGFGLYLGGPYYWGYPGPYYGYGYAPYYSPYPYYAPYYGA